MLAVRPLCIDGLIAVYIALILGNLIGIIFGMLTLWLFEGPIFNIKATGYITPLVLFVYMASVIIVLAGGLEYMKKKTLNQDSGNI